MPNKKRTNRRERRKAKQSGYRRVPKVGNKVGHGGNDSISPIKPHIRSKTIEEGELHNIIVGVCRGFLKDHPEGLQSSGVGSLAKRLHGAIKAALKRRGTEL